MQRQLPDATMRELVDYVTNNRLVALTAEDSEQIILIKLVTTYVYKVAHDGLEAEHCRRLRQYICAIDPGFQGNDIAYYDDYKRREEQRTNTYYGSYLSENSDSEEERQFVAKPPHEKKQILDAANANQEKAQIKKLTYQVSQNKPRQQKANTKAKRKPKAAKPLGVKGELRLHTPSAQMFDMRERTHIPYSNTIDIKAVDEDLKALNSLIKDKNLTIEAACVEVTRLAALKGRAATKFYVAQYRGITHKVSSWTQTNRRAHRRDQDEINKPQYSASVHAAMGISLFRNYAASKQSQTDNRALYDEKALLLKEILLSMRQERAYSYSGYSYSSLANLLQNIYTQDYTGFHQLIASHPELKEIFLNKDNPFVSMGDIPKHACAYAYGIKYYDGNDSAQLKPCWQRNGKAERPYIGVVYTSLHPLTDFTSEGPLHLITLNRNAEILVQGELTILPERESCFSALLPAERVCYKHVAKYPSFAGNYKQIYAYKYGLNKDIYEKFKAAIINKPPHSHERIAAETLLGEWLCSYYEVVSIKRAEQIAEARGGVMIYRDYDGTFTKKPPICSVNSTDKEMTAELKAPVKAKQAERRTHASPEKSIKPVTESVAIKSILGYTDDTSDEMPESVSAGAEGNHNLSLHVSLMLNALVNKRMLALARYLAIPSFKAAINEAFNSDGLDGARLIHIAVAKRDRDTLQKLLQLPECSRSTNAFNFRTRINGCLYSFGNLTPLLLAIVLGFDDIALELIADPVVDLRETCNFVSDHYNKMTVDCDDDTSTETVDGVTFIQGNTALHLAVMCQRTAIIDALKEKGVDVAAANSSGLTANQLAEMYSDQDTIKASPRIRQ